MKHFLVLIGCVLLIRSMCWPVQPVILSPRIAEIVTEDDT